MSHSFLHSYVCAFFGHFLCISSLSRHLSSIFLILFYLVRTDASFWILGRFCTAQDHNKQKARIGTRSSHNAYRAQPTYSSAARQWRSEPVVRICSPEARLWRRGLSMSGWFQHCKVCDILILCWTIIIEGMRWGNAFFADPKLWWTIIIEMKLCVMTWYCFFCVPVIFEPVQWWIWLFDWYIASERCF